MTSIVKAYNESQLWEFEKIILSEGNCKGFLRAGFVLNNQDLKVIYDTKGAVPLKNLMPMNLDSIFKLLIGVLEVAIEGENYLLMPWRYKLTIETVYVNICSGSIKILFAPIRMEECIEEGKCVSDFKENIVELIDEIGEISKKNWGIDDLPIEIKNIIEYMELLKKKIHLENPDIKGMIEIIRQMER